MSAWRERILPTLRVVAPALAAAIGGPVPAAVAAGIETLGVALGAPPGSTPQDIAERLACATPEQLAEVRRIEADFRVRMEQCGIDLERLAVENAAQVNAAIAAEAASEHWPTYSWRPAIGFSVAFIVSFTGLCVGVTFWGVLLGGSDPAILEHIPGVIMAMTSLVAMVSPILGIASWFRGRMQSDPSLPTINKG